MHKQQNQHTQKWSKIVPFIVASLVAVAPASFAQSSRVEINPFFGYTLSDGVTIDPVSAGGQTYDAVNAKSGAAYGIHFGVFVTEQVEVGFLWAREASVLQGEGTTTTDFTDMNINNYLGVFTYNFGDEDAQARPFILGGIGASSFAPSDINGQSIDSLTKFTGTFGGGVKFYPNPRFGISTMARWTPNYIKSDPDGVWCSPYWFYGCYVLSDAQYANQFELSAGVSLRF
jgi:OprF membrane domain